MVSRTFFRAFCTALQLWLAAWAILPTAPLGDEEENREEVELKGLVDRAASLPRRRLWWAPWAPDAVATARSGLLVPHPVIRAGLPQPDIQKQHRARLPRRSEPPEALV